MKDTISSEIYTNASVKVSPHPSNSGDNRDSYHFVIEVEDQGIGFNNEEVNRIEFDVIGNLEFSGLMEAFSRLLDEYRQAR